jgi:hypothetical protein
VTVRKMISDEITFFLRKLGWIYFYLNRAMRGIDAAAETFRLIDGTQYFHFVQSPLIRVLDAIVSASRGLFVGLSIHSIFYRRGILPFTSFHEPLICNLFVKG